MLIELKNKDTLIIGDFKLKCCIGKNGISKKKSEGDLCTPYGKYKIGNLYWRSDKVHKPVTNLRCKRINKNMGWCNDVRSKFYNKEFKIRNRIKHEKLYRNDYKYDLLIPIKYNFDKPILNKGSCIFIHLTKKFLPTAGCVGLKKKDFFIMLRLISKKTKIKIY